MHMAAKTRRWTVDELGRLPEGGNKYEVVLGELFVTPAPSVRHEAIVDVLARILDRYVEEQQLGRVSRPRTVLRVLESEVEPDILVRPVLKPLPTSWSDLPIPILVIEVLSETTRRRDLVQKRKLYGDAGVPEYWIVDGEDRRVLVARPGCVDAVCSDVVEWQPDGASAPLRVDVTMMFRDALD